MAATDFGAAVGLLSRYGFRTESIDALVHFHRSINNLQPFAFPWAEAEELLRSQGREVINLVGYGSLMHPVSAARSIASTPAEGHPPVVAIGARRVFNYRMPEAVFLRYGVPPGDRDRAALNAEPFDLGVVNGRLIQLNIDDLPNLRAREKAYDLQPVSCLDWTDRSKGPFVAYILCCQHENFDGQRFVDNALTPYVPYANLCREGAKMVSEEFLELYLETSFLADRVTTADRWEKDRGSRGSSDEA